MFLKRSSAKAISIAIFQRLTRCLQRLNNPIKSDGSALITAMILVVVIAMIAVAGTKLIMTSYNNVRHQQHQGAEVDNVARAGLVDAISWFKGQPQQPVCSPQGGPWADAAFNPAYTIRSALTTSKNFMKISRISPVNSRSILTLPKNPSFKINQISKMKPLSCTE